MKRTIDPSRPRAESPAQWLDELAAALLLPFERSEAIREELAEHLRERIRDLQLEGLNETDASIAAVKELGDAAAVARRFRMAERTPHRRMLMNLAVIGIAGAALVTSVIALSAAPTPPATPSQPAQVMAPGAADSAQARLDSALAGVEFAAREIIDFNSRRVRVEHALREALPLAIELSAQLDESSGILSTDPVLRLAPIKVQNEPLEAVLNAAAERAGVRAVVRWPLLEQIGIAPDDLVTLDIPAADLGAAMAAINDALGVFDRQHQRWLDCRVSNGIVEFAPRSFFDLREATVVRYDVAPLIDSGISIEDIRELIAQFVEPNNWADNGGDVAYMKHVGGRLFVKAPPRMHDSIKWYIEQLHAGAQTSHSSGRHGLLGDLPILGSIFGGSVYTQERVPSVPSTPTHLPIGSHADSGRLIEVPDAAVDPAGPAPVGPDR
ncbi:MAG: hypothetical protein KF869_03385 [Phycisphaeraceae bacterium]|nr:hypothetical protein [Phycisphaeraceae bacterium]